jgi:hypothetical protein
LTDFIAPKFFNAILSATRTVCGYGVNEDNDKTFKIPSLALKLGHALKMRSAEAGNGANQGGP